MNHRKTSSRRKAGQRNAQRGASHVGSGDVVGVLRALAKDFDRISRDNLRFAQKMGSKFNQGVAEGYRLAACQTRVAIRELHSND